MERKEGMLVHIQQILRETVDEILSQNKQSQEYVDRFVTRALIEVG